MEDVLFQENIKSLNALLAEGHSFRSACIELKLKRSTFQGQLKKAGYVEFDGQYVYVEQQKVQTSALLNALEVETLAIKQEVKTIVNSYLSIGCRLWNIRKEKLYKLNGHGNIAEYAEKELNLKKRSVYNFIAIVEQFCEFEFNDNAPVPKLKKDYNEFGYSQLAELLALSPEQRKKTNKDMTVKEIRELKDEEKDENTLTIDKKTSKIKLQDYIDKQINKLNGAETDFEKGKLTVYNEIKLFLNLI